MKERLQKLISASGLMSRRAAEEAIRTGRVTLNGETAALGAQGDPETDRICVDGRPLPAFGKRIYLMLHKPRGYVCTLSDEKGRQNVTALLKGVTERVYPVGRLDMYSEGLLLLTNDGDFANRLTHPSHEIEKTYETWVTGSDVGEKAELLRCPMELDGYVTAPAEVLITELLDGGAVLHITIHEGRNRQVRRMCELAGLKVTRLRRISEGPLVLGDLPCGKWRYLTDEEVEAILT